jgi:hypothetical protein
LWRALDVERGVRATLVGAQMIVTDLVSLADGAAVDHGGLMSVLEGARVKTPTFAVLGSSMPTRAELLARARALYAAGTPLDVRVEEQGRVLARRTLRVGRA